MSYQDLLKQIQKEVDNLPFILECRSAEICSLTGGNKHIELLMAAEDTQLARKQIDEYMLDKYPNLKFRYLFVPATKN